MSGVFCSIVHSNLHTHIFLWAFQKSDTNSFLKWFFPPFVRILVQVAANVFKRIPWLRVASTVIIKISLFSTRSFSNFLHLVSHVQCAWDFQNCFVLVLKSHRWFSSLFLWIYRFFWVKKINLYKHIQNLHTLSLLKKRHQRN